jgi:hypothetical protein
MSISEKEDDMNEISQRKYRWRNGRVVIEREVIDDHNDKSIAIGLGIVLLLFLQLAIHAFGALLIG